MKPIQEELLEALFFIISYDELTQQFNWTEKYDQALIELLTNSLVFQYHFEDGDFSTTQKLDTIQLGQYSYLISKKGLLVINHLL